MKGLRSIVLFTSVALLAGSLMAARGGGCQPGNKTARRPVARQARDLASPRSFSSFSYSPALPSTIRIWEAWAKGYVTIQQVSGLEYVVTNNGPVSVVIDEYTLLMSPSPANPSEDLPGVDDETQDGVITTEYTIPPGGRLTYNYGESVASGSASPPPWWCTERNEMTHSVVTISLGGEVLPYEAGRIINPYGFPTQWDLWDYLDIHPTLVIGKRPLWREVESSGDTVDVTLEITNIGFQDATGVVITDTLPAGYSHDASSFTLPPADILANPDGSTTITWDLARIDRARHTAQDEPTDYTTIYIGYTLLTPSLGADLRIFLPRATVDRDGDGIDDAESAEPLLETIFTQFCDIKPGSAINPINVKSRGVVPVAIYGSSAFDVHDIDPVTVRFGPAEAPEAHKVQIHYGDINQDGILDALFHFRTRETGIEDGDEEACISWEMFNGDEYTCCDVLVTVPKRIVRPR